MKWFCFTTLFLFSIPLWAQQRTFVGVDFAPLVINTADFHLERELFPFFSFQAGAGFRYQEVGIDGGPGLDFLRDYVGAKNYGGYLSAGGRIFNKSANPYEYPYIALDLVGTYYNEQIFVNHPDFGTPGYRDLNAVKFGFSFTIGFVIFITDRLYLDVGGQMGYSPMRRYSLSYYLPGLGYSTFGPNRFSLEGAHLQPVLTLKYELFKDKRDRIHDMD